MQMVMAASKLWRSTNKPLYGLFMKLSLAVILSLSIVVIWLTLSPLSSSSLFTRRSSFSDVESTKENKKGFSLINSSYVSSTATSTRNSHGLGHKGSETNEGKMDKLENADDHDGIQAADNNESKNPNENEGKDIDDEHKGMEERQKEDATEDGEETVDIEDKSDEYTHGDVNGGTEDNVQEKIEGKRGNNKHGNNNISGPLFDPKAPYTWKLCSGKSGHNYIPCIDLEGTGSGRLKSHRHHERSCPISPPMCLTPLPHGYESPIQWPDSKYKIFYRNVAHPKLSEFIKTQSWLNLIDNYLLFPSNESIYSGGAVRYLESFQEMAPDIDWGKNIRVILDIGSTDASFGFALLENDVLSLSLGLMNDQTDLTQLYLERGMPAILDSLRSRKLPLPYGVFDAVHCGECNIPWHSDGGRVLLEINRILRPGGYFLVSFRNGDIEGEEAMSKLTSSICWNSMAHKIDDETDLNFKLYQRPSSNDAYELRRTKGPPLCKSEENEDSVWYSPIEKCLHVIPTSIEQRGTDWPEEWPKRLGTFPEWLADSQEKLLVDTERWRAIVDKSYLNGMGIDWSHVRNVMDMKAVYGGFAAALTSHNVWVMNVVPVNAPSTLPIIYERGLIGVYHDWCEPFSTYPRSYDLLHADHLFSRLKNRCKQPVGIVIEMDRVLRPGGWVIIREKMEILNPLEAILKSLHWDIKMFYSQNKQGMICAQKTAWRP